MEVLLTKRLEISFCKKEYVFILRHLKLRARQRLGLEDDSSNSTSAKKKSKKKKNKGYVCEIFAIIFK